MPGELAQKKVVSYFVNKPLAVFMEQGEPSSNQLVEQDESTTYAS